MSDGPTMELTEFRIRLANGELEIARGTEADHFTSFDGHTTLRIKAGHTTVGEFFKPLGWFCAPPRRAVLTFEEGVTDALNALSQCGSTVSEDYQRGQKVGGELYRWRAVQTDIDNGYLELRNRKPGDGPHDPTNGGEDALDIAISALSPAPASGEGTEDGIEDSNPETKDEPAVAEPGESGEERYPFSVHYKMANGGFGSGAYETREDAEAELARLSADPTVPSGELRALVNGEWVIISGFIPLDDSQQVEGDGERADEQTSAQRDAFSTSASVPSVPGTDEESRDQSLVDDANDAIAQKLSDVSADPPAEEGPPYPVSEEEQREWDASIDRLEAVANRISDQLHTALDQVEARISPDDAQHLPSDEAKFFARGLVGDGEKHQEPGVIERLFGFGGKPKVDA